MPTLAKDKILLAGGVVGDDRGDAEAGQAQQEHGDDGAVEQRDQGHRTDQGGTAGQGRSARRPQRPSAQRENFDHGPTEEISQVGAQEDGHRDQAGRKIAHAPLVVHVLGNPLVQEVPAWVDGDGHHRQHPKGDGFASLRGQRPGNQYGEDDPWAAVEPGCQCRGDIRDACQQSPDRFPGPAAVLNDDQGSADADQYKDHGEHGATVREYSWSIAIAA